MLTREMNSNFESKNSFLSYFPDRMMRVFKNFYFYRTVKDVYWHNFIRYE